MTERRAIIRAAYKDACRQEIEALKPGNVHRFADGHGMSVEDFLTSAEVSAGPLTDLALPLGKRVLQSIAATRNAVGTNTNLGIVLLCAPVACAAARPYAQLQPAIVDVLESMTAEDAASAFQAIAMANPGGLGSGGENDVRAPPSISLLEAMREASSRDRIARQYASGYEDIFDVGLPALQRALESGKTGMWPTIELYFAFLTAFPDSHILRKFGLQKAMDVQREALETLVLIRNHPGEGEQRRILLAFDTSLKGRGINPGTTADLTVCCLFVHRLTDRLA